MVKLTIKWMIFSNPKDKQKKKSSAGATGEEFFRFN